MFRSLYINYTSIKLFLKLKKYAIIGIYYFLVCNFDFDFLFFENSFQNSEAQDNTSAKNVKI